MIIDCGKRRLVSDRFGWKIEIQHVSEKGKNAGKVIWNATEQESTGRTKMNFNIKGKIGFMPVNLNVQFNDIQAGLNAVIKKAIKEFKSYTDTLVIDEWTTELPDTPVTPPDTPDPDPEPPEDHPIPAPRYWKEFRSKYLREDANGRVVAVDEFGNRQFLARGTVGVFNDKYTIPDVDNLPEGWWEHQ